MTYRCLPVASSFAVLSRETEMQVALQLIRLQTQHDDVRISAHGHQTGILLH